MELTHLILPFLFISFSFLLTDCMLVDKNNSKNCKEGKNTININYSTPEQISHHSTIHTPYMSSFSIHPSGIPLVAEVGAKAKEESKFAGQTSL